MRPSSTIGVCRAANSAAITPPARPEAPKAAVLAHANTSSFSLASPCVMDEPCFAFSEAIGTRHRPQRRMSPVWESYCATRSRSSLDTEAPTEPLRESPDQSEA